LHSGDIGYVDEDGELSIIDRITEFIKYRGYQISPGETDFKYSVSYINI